MNRSRVWSPRAFLGALAGRAIVLFACLVTAPQAIWAGVAPDVTQRIYFGNHASHGDLVLLWSVLPAGLRRNVRPVAGADYWLGSKLRRFVGCEVFNALLVERGTGERKGDPVADLVRALDEGSSLIVFPEGRRNTTAEPLLRFKSGLYDLAAARPSVELVPFWIANLNRVLPKGELVPVPLLCKLTFGAPLALGEGEGRRVFLDRAEAALLALNENAGANGVDAAGGGTGAGTEAGNARDPLS